MKCTDIWASRARLNQEGNVTVLSFSSVCCIQLVHVLCVQLLLCGSKTFKVLGGKCIRISGIHCSHSLTYQSLWAQQRSVLQLHVVGVLCCVKSLSHVQPFVTPWTVAQQAPLSTGIFQARILQWVAKPSSSRSSQPWDWTRSLALQTDSLPSETRGKPICCGYMFLP